MGSASRSARHVCGERVRRAVCAYSSRQMRDALGLALALAARLRGVGVLRAGTSTPPAVLANAWRRLQRRHRVQRQREDVGLDEELAARRQRAARSPPISPGPITRRLCCRLLNHGSGKFRKKRRTLPSANRRAMSTDMLANTLRTLARPAAAHAALAASTSSRRISTPTNAVVRSSRARSIRKCASADPSSTSSGAPGLDLDARDVGDVEQVRLQRVDVLANAHGRRRQPRPSAWRELSASSSRNTAAGAAAACAPASAASMTSVGMRIAAARPRSARRRSGTAPPSCGSRRCRRRPRRGPPAPTRRPRPRARPPAPRSGLAHVPTAVADPFGGAGAHDLDAGRAWPAA